MRLPYGAAVLKNPVAEVARVAEMHYTPQTAMLSSILFGLVITPKALFSDLAPPPGTNPATIERILQLGKEQNQAVKHLLELTRTIGPRLTGSENGHKACLWAEAKFKEFGLANVHLEEWGEMPVSFNRGKRQSAKIVTPYSASMEFTTDAWTPGTDGPLRGRAIMEPATLDEFEEVKDSLKGAWLLSKARSGRGPGGGNRGELNQKIEEAGPLGRVVSSPNELLTTGGRFTGITWENLPKDRRIKIKKSDFDRIEGNLAIGKKVELEFDIENIFTKGPTKLYNVVADLPGTEKPDEYVIVCGHLDSWDGPGSVGANDNGTGSSVALEAARLLVKSGAKPKRTIRFILWTGEEQGLLGSRGYVQAHKDLWPKISACLNDDGGTNYQGGYQCLESQAPFFQPAMDVMNKAFPDLQQKLQIIRSVPRGGSSDHASFNMVGIPGFYTVETGRADYAFVWHTQNDRPEFSIAEYLVQSSTNHAIVSYSLACADALMPRERAGESGGPLPEPSGGRRNYEPAHDGHDHDDDYWFYVVDVVRRTLDRALRAAGG